MKKLIMAVGLMIVMVMGGGAICSAVSLDIDPTKNVCNDATIPQEEKDMIGCTDDTRVESVAVNIINVVLSLTGIVGVGVMVGGGILMSLSMGNLDKVKRARNMLLYGLIGMLVSLLAFAIVNWVLKGIS